MRRGVLINVSDPELEADGADSVTECQACLSIPGDGVRGSCTGEEIAGPQGYETVEAEENRGGSGYGFVGPLALCLDAQMSPGFGEGDLDLPSADEQGDDVGGREGDVGTEESLRSALAVGIANQHPSDRQHRGARPVPQGDVGCDIEGLAIDMAIPGGDDNPCPDCRGVGEQSFQFWQCRAFLGGPPHGA